MDIPMAANSLVVGRSPSSGVPLNAHIEHPERVEEGDRVWSIMEETTRKPRIPVDALYSYHPDHTHIQHLYVILST